MSGLSSEVLATNLVSLNLPKRALNPLLRVGIHTVEQVLELGEVGIRSVHNIGPDLAESILSRVAQFCSLPRSALDVPLTSKPTLSASPNLPSGILELPIDHVGITSSRAVNALKKNSIKNFQDLLDANRRGLANVKGLGVSGILSVESAIGTILENMETDDIASLSLRKTNNKTTLLEIDDSPPNLIRLIVPFAHAVLETVYEAHRAHRAYTLLKYYYRLENNKAYTLQDIGDAENITRERVRQINAESLNKIRDALFGRSNYVHWDIPHRLIDEATTLKDVFESIGKVAQETDLEKIVVERYGQPLTNKQQKHLRFLLTVFGFKRFSERHPVYPGSDIAAWSLDPQLNLSTIWKSLIGVYKTLQENVIPLSLFELKMGVNRKRKNRLDDKSIKCALTISPDIEIVGESQYQLKLGRLSSIADQAYRVLSISGEPLHFRVIAKEINHILAGTGYRPVQVRSLVGQMVTDSRLVSIGKSGIWSLTEWSHISTEATVKIMEEFFHLKKQRATVGEIHAYVISKRPQIPKESIGTYLYEKDAFIRVSETEYELTVWGSEPYHADNKRTSMGERIEPVVELFFKDRGGSQAPLRELVHEIEGKTRIANANIYAWLNRSGLVNIYSDSSNSRRKFVRYADLDSYTNHRERKTLRQQIQEETRRYLSAQVDKQAPLADIANSVMKKIVCKKHTFYQYVGEMDDVEKRVINRVTYCNLIEETEGIVLPFIFPQLSQITEEPLRGNIERAVTLLTIDNVDVGLFQLGKIFENELKEFLLVAQNRQVFSISNNDLRRLVDMIDCVVREGIMTKKHELSYLREERNERAHGRIPLQEEREKLLKYAPFLAGLYIDYVIIFHNERLKI